MRKEVEDDYKKFAPKVKVDEILKMMSEAQRPVFKLERDFFKKTGVSDRMIGNSGDGRFASEIAECHGLLPISEKEKGREPFLFVTSEQMAAYGVKGLSGRQNWKMAYEMASLVKNNKRDDDSSFIFCVDAFDRKDWYKAMSAVSVREANMPFPEELGTQVSSRSNR